MTLPEIFSKLATKEESNGQKKNKGVALIPGRTGDLLITSQALLPLSHKGITNQPQRYSELANGKGVSQSNGRAELIVPSSRLWT